MTGLPNTRILLDDSTGTFPHDVTTYARLLDGFNFNRGRDDEQSAVTAGTLSLAFNNADGRFTPGDTTIATPSPIVVDQRIRVVMSAAVSNTTFETNVTGYTGSNATLARSTAQAHSGVASMSITATAAANALAVDSGSGTGGIPVVAGAVYRVAVWARAATTVRLIQLKVDWWTSGGAFISTSTGTGVADTTTGWTLVDEEFAAPATAAYARRQVVVASPAASEVHYVDDFTFGVDRFTGYVKSWRVGWPAAVDTHSVVQVTATDAQARAERQPLKSIIEEEILADGPVAYYTLGEPAGATSAADHSGNQAPMLTMEGDGTDVVFGNATGPGTDGLTAAEFAGGKWLTGTASVSVVTIVFAVLRDGIPSLLDGLFEFGPGELSAWINTSGQVVTQNPSITSAASVADNATHVIALRLSGGTWTLYIDGVSAGSGSGSAPAAGAFLVGSGKNLATLTGSVAHLALFATAPAAGRMADHADAMLTGFAGESGTDRITRIAGYAGIPLGTLDTSLTNVAFKDITGASAWSAIQEVVDAEGGLAYVDGSGNTVFVNRNDAPEKTAPDLTLSAEFVHFDAQPTDDDAGIVNYFEATAEATGVTQVARDTASEDAHGRYPESKSYLVTADAEALDRANWIVANYAEPSTRYGTLTVNLFGMTTAQQDAAIAALEPGAWLQVTDMPSQTPGGATVDVMVQGFSEEQNASAWSLPCNVVNRELFTAAIYDNATYGVYGESKYYY